MYHVVIDNIPHSDTHVKHFFARCSSLCNQAVFSLLQDAHGESLTLMQGASFGLTRRNEELNPTNLSFLEPVFRISSIFWYIVNQERNKQHNCCAKTGRDHRVKVAQGVNLLAADNCN